MTVAFQIHALPQDSFSKYFAMDAAELKKSGAYKFVSDECPCYPCRVSLVDAEVGESVLAVTYEHNPVLGPYRSSGPIFVRADAQQAKPEINEIPKILLHRVLSIRAYSQLHRMVDARVAKGKNLERELIELLSVNSINYIHVHNAGPGCFNCAVTKVM